MTTATPLVRRDFWEISNQSRLQLELSKDQRIQSLRYLDRIDLSKFFEQYSFIVKHHANHLAIIISRMEESELKSLFADILYEELGSGKVQNSHLTLFSHFLTTLNPDFEAKGITARLEQKLEEYQEIIKKDNLYLAIGLGGAGTECICQVYLSEMYKQIKENPYIKNKEININWKFWEIHTGEVDATHKEQIKHALKKEIHNNPENEKFLIEGYEQSLTFWDNFLTLLAQT